MLKNKKLSLILTILLLVPSINAGILGVGQIGERYVYKINGILVSVAAGDTIDGCIIKAGSGLQCAQQNNNLNNTNALRDLAQELKKIDAILDKNQVLITQLEEKNHQINNIRKAANQTIIQKNKWINKLSERLNSR